MVLALVVTPDGFPLAYEIYPGNTRDTATLEAFLERIEQRYGKARRTWLMDRGVPTEDTLEKMRERGNDYLVGTPKGRLTELEKDLRARPWIEAREGVRVKGLEHKGELYVYVESRDRVAKERSMRRRRLKRLWARLKELRARKRLTRDDLLMDLGAAKKDAGLTSQAILDKISTIQMIAVHLPAEDGRRFILPRYTQPENDAAILLAQLGLTLPQQPAPRLLEPLSPNRVVPTF